MPNPDDDPETGPLLLVQGRKVIGYVTVEPPPGATGYRVRSPGPAAINSPVTGLPTAHLRMTFQAGNLPGGYLINVHMIGGNSVQFVVVAV